MSAGDEHSHHSHPTPPHNHPHTPTHSMSPHPHEQFGMKRSGQDVASKSLSDLESLVDQIPSIADNNNQRIHNSQGMDDAMGDKLDSSHHQGYMTGFPAYSPPLNGAAGGGVYPGAGDYGAMYGMSGRQGDSQQQQQSGHSKNYTVENLASSNYTPQQENAYANSLLPGPHYPVPMGSTNGYLFGGLESSLIQRTYGMGGMHPGIGHMPNPYPYNSTYSSSFDAYAAPPGGIHAPSANYPGYAGPPSTTPPGYLPSHHRPPVDLSYDGV